METFVIRRRGAWASPDELQATAARSSDIGDNQMSDQVRWIRSYVVDDDDRLGTVCIYEATSAAALADHAARVGMPADEITAVADTVIVRPDPVATV